ncbi:MAG TPA: serine/threonine-protein kinase [Pyrinomonadaceae bacterium]
MSTSQSYDFPPETIVAERYVLHEIIGRGGYGIVYRVSDEKFSPPVEKALKFLRLTRDAADWRWERFLKEASLLARLNHQGLVKVMDQGTHNGFLYFVMEYLGQETLRSVLKQCHQGLPLKRAAKALRQLGEALAAVHSQQLYHCDLKPANIMIYPLSGGAEQTKIIDFGTARLIDSLRAQEQNVPFPIGTLKYMAPEQFSVAADSAQITAATDIYAFALVAYQMLTGQHPFDDQQAMILPSLYQDALRVPASQLRHELNAEVDKILRRALAYNSADRYQDAGDFAEHLAAALEMKYAPGHSTPTHTLPISQVLLLAANATLDQQAAAQLAAAFRQHGFAAAYTDDAVGVEVAEQLEEKLGQAQLIVALVSTESLDDAVWATLTAQANDLADTAGQWPRLIFLALEAGLALPEKWRHWPSVNWRPAAPEAVLVDILAGPPTPPTLKMARAREQPPEPPVGALRPGHPLYVERADDARFLESVERRRSILLVQAPRQFGKTSLLSRGIEKAGGSGFRVVNTDCQSLDQGQFDSLKTFYLALRRNISRQLRLPKPLHETWDELAGPNENFAEYMRDYVLAENHPHLLWVVDEADRIFGYPYCNDVFAMFRSWHNSRSNDTAEGRAWGRLTLVISYATEAGRLISDQNQSPFNVGVKCVLPNFELEQVADLNGRYGHPLRNESEHVQFHAYTGGHPFLTQHCLGLLARRGAGALSSLQQEAAQHVGPFGDHLRHLAQIVQDHPRMREGLSKLLRKTDDLTNDEFYDLWASGLVVGRNPAGARLSSQLYADFFRSALSVGPPLPPQQERLPSRFLARLKSLMSRVR